ncbi:DUF2474 family protein [Roseospira goensis]|uniref:Fatty acid desaturase n=1 Tax=Roseospira goensis TaxID=391922 RepID=A0A7W6WJR6_9PROT|nr:DUF2474 family protein [Roseospira goensis]MBB4284773.1 fatty acid desaturase [Roseospira goensis]
MAERTDPAPPLWRRLAWFIGLWAAGVATVAAVAYGWRLLVAGVG